MKRALLAGVLLTACHAAPPAVPAAPPPAAASPTQPSATWTVDPDPHVLTRLADSAVLDALPGAPVSAAQPNGTLVIALPVDHIPTLVEWDVAASRVLRVVRLDGEALRAVRVGATIRVLTLAPAPELVTLDLQLRVLGRAHLDLGPQPSGVSLVADAQRVVVAATIAVAVGAPSRRVTVFDATSLTPLAHVDTHGPADSFGMVREDTLVLRGEQLFVVERDPEKTSNRPSLDRPTQPGPLGVGAFDVSTLRRTRFAAAPKSDGDVRAGLYATASGVVLANDEWLTTYDAKLRPTSHAVRGLGPYLAQDDHGALLHAPKASAVLPVPADPLEDVCVPVWAQPAAVVVCSTMSEDAGRAVSVLPLPPWRLLR